MSPISCIMTNSSRRRWHRPFRPRRPFHQRLPYRRGQHWQHRPRRSYCPSRSHDTIDSYSTVDNEEHYEDEGIVIADFGARYTDLSTYGEYLIVNNRSYSGIAWHWAPNDHQHSEVLDCNHLVYTEKLGKLQRATLPNNIQSVLDVGTGTGKWALQFAAKHPSARIIGTDISPTQPTLVPPNLEFLIDDFNRDWEISNLDYIHMRDLKGSVSNWCQLLSQAYLALRPGGIIEIHEGSHAFGCDSAPLEDDSYMKQWERLFKDSGERCGRLFTIVEDGTLTKSARDAGFDIITNDKYTLPIGPWPKCEQLRKLGVFTQAALQYDLDGFVYRLATEKLGWSREETTVFAARLRNELRSDKKQTHIQRQVIIAYKPYKGCVL